MTYSDGAYYEGTFEFDEIHGIGSIFLYSPGTYRWADN